MLKGAASGVVWAMGAAVRALSLLLVVAVTRPAGAALPGTNGKIAFVSDGSVVAEDPATTDTEQIPRSSP